MTKDAFLIFLKAAYEITESPVMHTPAKVSLDIPAMSDRHDSTESPLSSLLGNILLKRSDQSLYRSLHRA